MSENVSIVVHKPFQASGITSTTSTFKACLGVRENASIKAYPTSAGTATVYSSCSPYQDCLTDIANNNFTTGVASWDAWGAGAVTAKTVQYAQGALSCVTIVPASGTWVLEVAQ